MLKKNEYSRDLLCIMYSGLGKYLHFTAFPRVGPVKILTLSGVHLHQLSLLSYFLLPELGCLVWVFWVVLLGFF